MNSSSRRTCGNFVANLDFASLLWQPGGKLASQILFTDQVYPNRDKTGVRIRVGPFRLVLVRTGPFSLKNQPVLLSTDQSFDFPVLVRGLLPIIFLVGQFLVLMKFRAAKNRVLDFFEKIEKYFFRLHF